MVAQEMMKTSKEKGDVDIFIPSIHGDAAQRVLEYLSHPPSTIGSLRLEIKKKTKGAQFSSKVTMNGLEDIGWALLLQTVRRASFGALVFSKGRSSDTNMLFFGPGFEVE